MAADDDFGDLEGDYEERLRAGSSMALEVTRMARQSSDVSGTTGNEVMAEDAAAKAELAMRADDLRAAMNYHGEAAAEHANTIQWLTLWVDNKDALPPAREANAKSLDLHAEAEGLHREMASELHELIG